MALFRHQECSTRLAWPQASATGHPVLFCHRAHDAFHKCVLVLWEMEQNRISFRACFCLCQWGQCWSFRLLMEQSQPDLSASAMFHLLVVTLALQVCPDFYSTSNFCYNSLSNFLTAKILQLGVWKYWKQNQHYLENKSSMERLTQGVAACHIV